MAEMDLAASLTIKTGRRDGELDKTDLFILVKERDEFIFTCVCLQLFNRHKTFSPDDSVTRSKVVRTFHPFKGVSELRDSFSLRFFIFLNALVLPSLLKQYTWR